MNKAFENFLQSIKIEAKRDKIELNLFDNKSIVSLFNLTETMRRKKILDNTDKYDKDIIRNENLIKYLRENL